MVLKRVISRIKSRLQGYMPKRLMTRTILILGLPILLAQGVTTFVFYDRQWDKQTTQLSDAIISLIAIHAERSAQKPYLGAKTLAESLQRYGDYEVSFNPDSPLSKKRRDRYVELAAKKYIRFPWRSVTGRDTVTIDIQLPKHVMRVAFPRQMLYHRVTDIFMMWAVGAPFFFFLVALMFLRNQIKPIRILAQGFEAYGKGRLQHAIKPTGAIEVRQAATAFNRMRERLETYRQEHNRILHGISTDLHTPVERLRLQLSVMPQNEQVTALRQDVEDVKGMIVGYLSFVSAQEDELPQDIDFAQILHKIQSGFASEGWRLDFNAYGAGKVHLRFDVFCHALSNIIDNALKYGNYVSVDARLNNKSLKVIVEDDGPGLDAKDEESVFKPFYRGASARAESIAGAGLGLTIAKDIILRQGGTITLDASEKGGVRATVTLPL